MNIRFPRLLLLAPLFIGSALLHAAPVNTAVTPMPTHLVGRHAEIIRLNKELRPALIFIGDSITHQFGGTDSRGPDGATPYGIEVWNHYYAPRKAVNKIACNLGAVMLTPAK